MSGSSISEAAKAVVRRNTEESAWFSERMHDLFELGSAK
jgi:hypothetical protein